MPPLSIMIKPASGMCNMRCAYCFYHDVAQHRDMPSHGMMTKETVVQIIEKALAFAQGEQVSFAFQGGEPLLAGLDFFRFFTQTLREKNTRNSPVCFGMQTNGLLLDQNWAAFLREEKFLVGLSLDGDNNANRYRRGANGQRVWQAVMDAAALLLQESVDFNILTVLTGYCAEHCEDIYRFFKRQGFRHLQFIPCLRPFSPHRGIPRPLERGTSPGLAQGFIPLIGNTADSNTQQKSDLYMTSAQYADFLTRLFRLYVKDFAAGNYVSIRQFDNYVRMYLGERPEQCGMAGHCSFQFVVEGGGDVFPCDFYCIDAWRLGNINETGFREMNESEPARRFIQESLQVAERCRQCKFYPLCRGGGCKRYRENEDHCAAYRAFFEQCLPLFRVFTAN